MRSSVNLARLPLETATAPANLYCTSDQLQLAAKATSALSPQTWPFSLEWLPPATYLVGGNVRDALLGRYADYLDLDFVLPERAVETAKAIANHYRAGFVLLDAERQIARVVFERTTADFAQQVGPTLEDDLRRRDFTVNAIAYNPHTEQLIDPLHGYQDLQQHLIRMVAPENLKEDPLRLLRAYRQAAQLEFALEPKTRATIQQLANLLKTIAPERVQAELNYLLNSPRGTPFLSLAVQDELLVDWLPHATSGGLQLMERLDAAAIALKERWPAFGVLLTDWIKEQPKNTGICPTWFKIARLASLVAPDLAIAEQELWHLKYSRAEVQAVVGVLRRLPLVADLLRPEATRKDHYLFFKAAGASFPAIAVLAVATGISLEAIAPLVVRYLTPNDPVAHPPPLLTGNDLMKALQLKAGPQIGQLLEAIQLAQAEGKVETPSEAIAFAQQLLSLKEESL